MALGARDAAIDQRISATQADAPRLRELLEELHLLSSILLAGHVLLDMLAPEAEIGGGVADAEDRADVGVGHRAQDPGVEAAHGVDRLGEEHALLHVGEGDRTVAAERGDEPGPEAGATAVDVVEIGRAHV